jgi:hypothetical protein
MGKCYQITHRQNCYQDLMPLLASCAGIYAAVHARLYQSVPSNPSDSFVIECKYLDARVVLPLHGPIEAAIENVEPQVISVGVLPGRASGATPLQHQLSGFVKIFDTLMQPYLTNQYERHKAAMLQRHHSDRTKLPQAWQMAWAIRNGLSHNGKVHFEPPKQTSKKPPQTPAPVHWRGLKIGPENQGQIILGNLLNFGDLIVLSLDMEEELAGKVPWLLMRDQGETQKLV